MALSQTENWHKLNCRLVWAYEGPVDTQFRAGAFRQEAVAAWLILRGDVRLTFPHSVETCEAGYWYFPKREAWRQEFSPDAEILSVRFIAQWPDTSPLFDHSRSLKIPAVQAPRLVAIARRLARYLRDQQIQGNKGGRSGQMPRTLKHYVGTQRLFLDWLAVYVDLMNELGVRTVSYLPLDERVLAAVNQMERANLHEAVREADLARLNGMSKSHLIRMFVEGLGMTPAEYWEERRVNAARSALLESERSVKAIAYELGFSSLSHFSTWVRNKLGCSPRAFRKQAASGKNPSSAKKRRKPSPTSAAKRKPRAGKQK